MSMRSRIWVSCVQAVLMTRHWRSRHRQTQIGRDLHGLRINRPYILNAFVLMDGKAVQAATKRNLCKIKGLSETKVDKIKEAASKLFVMLILLIITADKPRSLPVSIQESKSLCNDRGSLLSPLGLRHWMPSLVVPWLREMTGDCLREGGIQSMSITEVYGEFRCGKTQLCHTMCVTSQLPRDMGGAEGKVFNT